MVYSDMDCESEKYQYTSLAGFNIETTIEITVQRPRY